MAIAGRHVAVSVPVGHARSRRLHTRKRPPAPLGIVVDVLRATSTIAQALAVRLPAGALLRRDRGRAPPARARSAGSLVGGERNAVADRGVRRRRVAAGVPRAAGRHADPLDDERDAHDPDRGRRAATRSCSARCSTSSAVAEARARARAWTSRSSAPGFKGAFALDDAYCAGRIVALLDAERSDAAIAAELVARSFADRARGAERADVRAARARGGHPLLLARERPPGRAAASRGWSTCAAEIVA